MVARDIQRIEVVVVIFDFRAGRDGKAELTEETFDTVDGAGNRVQSAVLNTTSRQRDINGFRGQARVKRCAFELGLTRVKRLLDLLFGFVDNRAGCRALFSRQLAQGRHLKGQKPFFTQVFHADVVQRSNI